MCSRISWCFGQSFYADQFQTHINELDEQAVTAEERVFIRARYLRSLRQLDQSAKRVTFWFYGLSSIVTVGSLLVPALISVQDRPTVSDANDADRRNHENQVYWAVWGLSVAVTTANAIIKLMQLDRTSVTRVLRLNQLKGEGSLYLTGSGEYAQTACRRERFRLFAANVERIKREQMLEEYTQHRDEPAPTLPPARQLVSQV
jgi:hypothetical protein